jgi:hypothetical protein
MIIQKSILPETKVSVPPINFQLTFCLVFYNIWGREYPYLRKRFIADTLYKKLWIHDYKAMSILDVAFLLDSFRLKNRAVQQKTLS